MSCEVSRRRAGMTDEEFDANVARSLQFKPEDDEDQLAPLWCEVDLGQPCGVCGASGACGYDLEGRPMIHATPSEEELTA